MIIAWVLPIVLVLIVVYISFAKKRKASFKSFPVSYLAVLQKQKFYLDLKKAQQKVFEQRILQFLEDVYIEGVKTEITNEDKLLVAMSAVIPTLGFKNWHYPNLSSVLVYPDHFNGDLQFEGDSAKRNVLGLVGNGQFKNTMILSKKALHIGFENTTDKENTAIHEFAHLIDGFDGDIDGIPEHIIAKPYVVPWLNLMHEEMKKIQKHHSDIRAYGATSQSEFFAVAAEYFFSRPRLFKKKHPELYKILSRAFNQDIVTVTKTQKKIAS
ncbi:zinc-dependent peptidase [Zhouia sp. PK063]|uniref:zinc-dependent peptidase n=1 Tax=Zhouia sp. PK063 TaxID=3373602 RepID=UPI00379182BA